MVHGVAQRITDGSSIERFTAQTNAKYQTDITVAFFTDNACFRLEPHTVFGLVEADFTGSPTRWDLGGEL